MHDSENRMNIRLRAVLTVFLSCWAEWGLAWTLEQRQPPFQFQQVRVIELTALAKADKPWRLCALYPHMKDSYWLSINYGMVSQARQLGVSLRVAEAGGYHQLERQWQQVQECISWQADAILLGTVSYRTINERLSGLNSDIPLFGLVNNLSPDGLAARTGVPWYRMGFLSGQFLAERHPSRSGAISIAWFPGPEHKGGTPEAEQGLRDALQGTAVNIVASAHGDNDRNVQRTLVQQVLDQYPDIDYLVGSAVMAEVAVNELRRRGMDKPPQIISHYLSHGVYRGLKRGRILAANSDQMVLQGRIAVDQAVRFLQGEQTGQDIGPGIIRLTPDNLNRYPPSESLSPAGFKPVYRVN